jgi:hypothetical protein
MFSGSVSMTTNGNGIRKARVRRPATPIVVLGRVVAHLTRRVIVHP